MKRKEDAMRIPRVLLLAGLAAVVAAIVAGASPAKPVPPGADYPWAQPGAAVASVCCTQPVFTFAPWVNPAAAAAYAWAQPKTAPVSASFAQPPGT